MDLLANYGSDEEDGEAAVPSTSGNTSVLSLPPPRASAQELGSTSGPVSAKSGSALGTKRGGSGLPSDFFDGLSVGLRGESSAVPSGFADETSKTSHDEISREVGDKPSSLFSKLPPPASSTRLSLASLPPPSNSKSKKTMVEFKPPVNLSVLETTDEDEEGSRKRSKISEMNKTGSGAKVGGLAALLPPPKNSLGSGLAFGGGGGGRRTAMETASVATNTKDVILPARSVSSERGDRAAGLSAVGSSEIQRRMNSSMQHHYSAQPGQGPTAQSPVNYEQDVRMPEGNFVQEQHPANVSYNSVGYESYDADGGYQIGVQQGYTNWEYPDAYGVAAAPSSSNVPDPLAEVLQRERRKGRNEPPPQLIEVKQADLTGGRLREDQLRTTGIAFGPNYQPVSAGKDKPSKIHRRKHQIGALYFDMKSKEMELLDRRAKGNLTKAETQAKYGW